MKYNKYLFDLDGVIVDTVNIQYDSTRKAIKEHCNYDIQDDNEVNNVFLKTITTKDKLKYLNQKNIIEKKDINIIYDLKKNIANKIFINLKRDTTKIELFSFLKERKNKIAVVTNSNKNSAEIVLKALGLYDFIDLLISNEDVSNCKPHSEPYIKAIAHFGGSLSKFIIFEDSESGLISARGTGCFVYHIKNVNNLNLNLITKLNLLNINILIPMAGLGSRFTKRGFKSQKPLIELNNKTLIEHSISSLNIEGNYIFIIRKKNNKSNIELINILKEIKKNCKIIEIDYVTEGSASTCYLAKEMINDNNELIIANCDQILEWDSEKFLDTSRSYEACVLTYISNDIKNSFIKLENNLGIEIKEKEAISDTALVGVHYFKRGKDFVLSYEEVFKKKFKFKNEYYVSTVCDNLIKQGIKFGHHLLTGDEIYYSTGKPEDYFEYLNTKNLLNTQIFKFKDMFRGWYIGNFEPCAYKTKDFEVGYLLHKKGEQWDVHYHRFIKEINFLVKGKMILNNLEINEGDIFIIDKNEIACPIFLEDCYIFVVKVPSVIGDKIIL